MALIPRPARAPISPCENGLVGRPVVMLGEATLLVGSNGAARLNSAPPVCQPCGTDSPPACIAWAMDAWMPDPHLDSWPPTPAITVAALPSTILETFSISELPMLARVLLLALLAPPLPELRNIRAGVLPNMPV